MDARHVTPLIEYLHSWPSEGVSFLLLILSLFCLLGLFRFFGLTGLIVYSVISTILGNIQVLKSSLFSFGEHPIALGTLTFATIFLANDMITEHYGSKQAKKNIWLCFFAQVISMLIMILTLAHPPLSQDENHQAMEILFLPSPRLVLASLIAFLCSMMLEIIIFQGLRRLTQERHLWLRTSLSSIGAAFIDNLLFSVLAWVILASSPVTWDTLFWTYILGAYGTRILVSLLTTPVLYISYTLRKKNFL